MLMLTYGGKNMETIIIAVGTLTSWAVVMLMIFKFYLLT